ncbi:hypothetical protein L9F63_008808, partial [Diploptera punctata]
MVDVGIDLPTISLVRRLYQQCQASVKVAYIGAVESILRSSVDSSESRYGRVFSSTGEVR